MDNIIKNCEDNKVSVSDYLCSLAEKDYLSQNKDPEPDLSSLSRLEKALFFIVKKPDSGAELIRLYNNGDINKEEMIDLYIKLYSSKIQIENTEWLSELIDTKQIQNLIYSKRDTLNQIALDNAKEKLLDNLDAIDNKKQKELEKQEQEQRFYEWNKQYNGKYPRHFMTDYKPDEYETKLEEWNTWNNNILSEQEFDSIVDDEEKKEEKKEEIEIESAPFSNWILTDEEISELLGNKIEQLA